MSRRNLIPVLVALSILTRSGASDAHEHMYVASTARNRGTLILDYDFTRPFPLAELANQRGTWIGVDPSLNSLVADDPARSLYRLKKGTAVTLEIVSIEPAASVLLAGRTLTAAGQRAVAGRMPYLHIHPQWTLRLPVGEFGDARVSIRVRAPGYKSSATHVGTLSAIPTTTTSTTTTTGDGSTTTTFEGQTTTTTLPPPCTASSCDDRDACTTDVCDGAVCQHTPEVDAGAVLCKLRGFQGVLDHEQPTSRKGRRVLGRLYTAVIKAREATQTARTDQTPRRMKQVSKRVSGLTNLVDFADRSGEFAPETIVELQQLATTAYDALTLWQQSGS